MIEKKKDKGYMPVSLVTKKKIKKQAADACVAQKANARTGF